VPFVMPALKNRIFAGSSRQIHRRSAMNPERRFFRQGNAIFAALIMAGALLATIISGNHRSNPVVEGRPMSDWALALVCDRYGAGEYSLKQEYIHNATAQFFSANPLEQKNVMLMINVSAVQNAVVNADDINTQGIRTTHPVNADGVYNVFAIIDWGFRAKEINTRFTLGGNVFFNKLKGFLGTMKVSFCGHFTSVRV